MNLKVNKSYLPEECNTAAIVVSAKNQLKLFDSTCNYNYVTPSTTL